MKKIVRITALVMACVLMALSFAACTATTKEEEVVRETKRYSVTYYADEVPSFVADQIKKSVKIYDSENDVDLGLVTEALVEDSICYASDSGKLILTTKTGYRSLLISATVEASEALEGWYIGDTLYGIGHTDTLHVGNTEVELTLRSFEALD
ncbi:MAG: hypothetical protein IKT46_06820 [Clostridia bacterium]|nr:hypothetical protein [Clostridia bacterium]